MARPGWKGTDGTLYALNDRRLVGMGNPPSCPTFQTENPGAGRRECAPVNVDGADDKLKEV